MYSKKLSRVGIFIVLLYILVAVFADAIAPYNAYERIAAPYERPSASHLLGTNDIGQDLLSEMIMGTRNSILIGAVSAAISICIAIIIGVSAGLLGGTVDSIFSKVIAFFLTIPFLPLVIVLAAFLRGGSLTTAIVLGVVSWPVTARILRAETISIKSKEYILLIQGMGAGKAFIMKKHILRELLPLLAYQFIARFKSAILAESSLGFLGLGSVTVKSWGSILYYAQVKNALITNAWLWWVIPPGLLIAILAFSLMLVGYGIEANMNPRME